MVKKVVCLVSIALISCVAANSSAELVAHYPMNEGGGAVVADSVGDHDGTIVGAPTWVEGPSGFGSALQFGTSGCDGVEAGEWTVTEGTDELSATCWINFQTGGSQYQGIVASRTNYDNANYHWALEIGGESGGYYFGSRNGSAYGLGTAPEGEWAHVAITFDGSTIIAYLNGEESGTGSPSFGDGRDTVLRIGSSEAGGNIFEGGIDDVRLFNHILSPSEVVDSMLPLAGQNSTQASRPQPADLSEDTALDIALSWTPGAYAVTHDVYLGTDFTDVNDASRANPGDVLVSQGQAEVGYAFEALELETTYYWRVDEVNASPSTIFKGSVWSFTTEPVTRPLTNLTVTDSGQSINPSGPENVINDSGLDENDLHSNGEADMWFSAGSEGQPAWLRFDFGQPYLLADMLVWNANQNMESVIGMGIKDALIETSIDGETWTVFDDNAMFNRGTGLPGYAANTIIDFSDTVARFVKLTAKSNWGGLIDQYGLSEVRFSYIPTYARLPQPEDGTALDVLPDQLSWRSGRQALEHEVYLGTDVSLVEAGDISALAGITQDAELDIAGQTVLGHDYFWTVVEVNELALEPRWTGPAWSFTTPAYLVVDDMESYNDDVEGSQAIFVTWEDGYNISGNGSQVGHDDLPFAEETIVHGGTQSMPLYYGKEGNTVSEATRTFKTAQDWTQAGITALVIHFYGQSGNEGQLYAKINGQKVMYNGDAADLASPLWTAWSIDLASVNANLADITTLSIGVEGGTEGLLLVDDIRLYSVAPATVERKVIEAEAATSLPQPWEIIGDSEASGGKYIAIADGAENNIDGPLLTGLATYSFTVAGGVYNIRLNVDTIANADSDSLWVRVPGAAIEPAGNAANPGWVRANSLYDQPGNDGWHWIVVWDNDNGNQPVEYTLAAGTHTLEIGHREAGVSIDTILIESAN